MTSKKIDRVIDFENINKIKTLLKVAFVGFFILLLLDLFFIVDESEEVELLIFLLFNTVIRLYIFYVMYKVGKTLGYLKTGVFLLTCTGAIPVVGLIFGYAEISRNIRIRDEKTDNKDVKFDNNITS